MPTVNDTAIDTQRVAGQLILIAVASLRRIPANRGLPALISRPRPLQQKLLGFLCVDPPQPS